MAYRIVHDKYHVVGSVEEPRLIGNRYHVLGSITEPRPGWDMFWFWPEHASRFFALDSKTGKVVTIEGISANEYREVFRKVSAVNHPNVARITDITLDHIVIDDLLPASVYDLIKNKEQLPPRSPEFHWRGSVFVTGERLPAEKAADICRQAALGLEALSESGLFDSDFLPHRLLLSQTGTVKVRVHSSRQETRRQQVTSRAELLEGSPMLWGPEQLRGEPIDTRSVIYSLGMILYRMVAGRFPFESQIPWEIVKQHLESVPRGIYTLGWDEDNWKLSDVLERCLEKDPKSRYQTFGELAEALRIATISDRDILVSIYKATNGPSWFNNSNWLTEAPLSEWYGVTSKYAAQTVTELALGSNNLNGVLPTELGSLWDLEHLDLRGNRLKGMIPSELCNLSRLISLDLYRNKLTGEVPSGLGSLSDLSHLDLGGNDLHGEIPSELARLSKLSYLSLDQNNLTGQIPSEFANLTCLKSLKLANNKISRELPRSLNHLFLLGNLSEFSL